jgi:ketosteroid isomerase-like protein
MRNLILGALVCFVVGVSSAAQAPPADPQIMAPINKFMEAFNKGDMTGAAATHSATADLAIVDEVPPFAWTGAQAFQSWAAALQADSKKNGMSEEKVAIKAPTRVETAGSDAYVIVPAVFTFKQKGVTMRESAQMTFVLKKEAGGWMIHGWTWTGPRPQKAAGTPAK